MPRMRICVQLGFVNMVCDTHDGANKALCTQKQNMQTLLGTLEKQLIGNALRRPSYGRLSVNGMNPTQAYDQIKFSFIQRNYLRDIREGLT